MQITTANKTTTVNEEQLLNIIVRTDVQKLESVFSDYYQCKFLDIPEDGRNDFLYLCRVELDIKADEIADIYDFTQQQISGIIKKCYIKWCVNDEYCSYLRNLHDMYHNIKQTA